MLIFSNLARLCLFAFGLVNWLFTGISEDGAAYMTGYVFSKASCKS